MSRQVEVLTGSGTETEAPELPQGDEDTKGSDIAFEAGKYEYDPNAIAAQETVVLVDKPEAQTSAFQTANNFNVQYETACPKDKDANEIRQKAYERGGHRPRPNTVRYYADAAGITAGMSAGGEEVLGLQAGQLADETREALGLGPLDPPPWLDKMRQLGYPPMYKHNKRKDELFIFDDQTGSATTAASDAGASSRQAEGTLQQGQELVMFPGVNAPAPPGADARLWGVSLAHLPPQAGSKRSHPEYPTQEDIAAAPPLKRIKPNETPPHCFTFNFQQPGQPSGEPHPSSATAHDQPFVFTAGAQSPGGASRQNSWQNAPSHCFSAGSLPASLTPTGLSTAGSNPFPGLPFNPTGDPAGAISSLPAASLPHNTYPGFAPPACPLGYAAPTSHMPPNAAAAYGHSLYGMAPSASLAYPYGMPPPSYHTGFPGMHPSYAAFTAQPMPTQYPYPPQYSAAYQQTPSVNLQMGLEAPPPPRPFPPV
ncbi:hypothetical protein ABBQ32_009841 [Trebouxia sp. C0010 RCD-2024]